MSLYKPRYVKQAHLIGGHFEIQDGSLNQMIQYIVLIGFSEHLYRNQHRVSVRLIDDDTGRNAFDGNFEI